MVKRYVVFIDKDKTSAWSVTFVDLPINVIDDTLEECLAECQNAFEEFMETEDTLPEPTPVDLVPDTRAVKESTGLMLVEIDVSFFHDPTERRTASAKRSQWEAIDKAAKAAGKTRSAYMVEAAIEKAKKS